MESSCFHVITKNHSGKDSENPKAVVPWKDLLSRSSEYISSLYLPSDAALLDPSHLRADTVSSILGCWYGRQAQGKPVLRFKQVLRPGNRLSQTGSFQSRAALSRKARKEGDRHAGRPADCTNPEEENGFVNDDSDDDQVGATSGLTRNSKWRPTVAKRAAGPGWSSKGCQNNDDSSLPDHPTRWSKKSQSKLPTPTSMYGDSPASTCLPEPSVRLQ